MSRGFATFTVGPSPTDAALGFMRMRATDVQDNGVGSLTVNAALAAVMRPRGNVEQRLYVKVTAQLPAGPKALWGGEIISWSCEESATAGGQWTLVTAAHRETSLGGFDHGFFGWELDYENAPPPGNGTVKLELFYGLPDGSIEPFTLFVGYSMSANRTDDPAIGHRLELSGMTGEAFIDRAVGEVQFPPLHGLTPGEIARALLLAGGMPASRIKVGVNVGTPRQNAFDHPCAEVWSKAKECLRQGAGHELYIDRQNFAQSRVAQGGIYV